MRSCLLFSWLTSCYDYHEWVWGKLRRVHCLPLWRGHIDFGRQNIRGVPCHFGCDDEWVWAAETNEGQLAGEEKSSLLNFSFSLFLFLMFFCFFCSVHQEKVLSQIDINWMISLVCMLYVYVLCIYLNVVSNLIFE